MLDGRLPPWPSRASAGSQSHSLESLLSPVTHNSKMNRSREAEKNLELRLSDADMAALRQMRSQIYRGGAQGGAAGFIAGWVGCWAAPRVGAGLRVAPKLAMAVPMATFAAGTALGSLVSARNNAHTIQFIVHKSSKPELSTYQERREMMQRLEEAHGSNNEANNLDLWANKFHDPVVKELLEDRAFELRKTELDARAVTQQHGGEYKLQRAR